MATPGFDSTFHPWVAGQLTATRTRILGSDVWQTNTQYYDDRGRVIQIVEDNRLGGLSRIDLLYDFIGNLTHQRESHGKADGSADVLESENSYDEQGRLLAQSITLNGGTAATLTYSYDALGRLTYDRNGNLQSLQRTAGGKVVDNLGYTYSGNLLTGLSESVRTAASDDVYAPGTSETGTYAYDLNGNLKKASRRALLFAYNSLNLLSEVRRDGQPAAKYDWLADGTKLGVRDGSGTEGFEYVGSLIYRKSGSGLHLCEATTH